jgi:hypothetical protein
LSAPFFYLSRNNKKFFDISPCPFVKKFFVFLFSFNEKKRGVQKGTEKPKKEIPNPHWGGTPAWRFSCRPQAAFREAPAGAEAPDFL